ncbi:MAG: hypothetical protein RIM23_09940 [Coleofasciculus sp. G3-WIS-01]|uniref:hypothetical protein n=1 Tax=Coleofasciculus sp. G3-WIS-01 TaxID=3069528 RepID=UPI0032F5F69F
MAKEVISIINTIAYVDDFGESLSAGLVTARLKKPTWMSDQVLDTLLAAFGFRRIGDDESFPCSPGSGYRYRRMTFETIQGSFSLPLGDSSPNVEAVQEQVNAIKAVRQVLCLRKEGERKLNVYNELRNITTDVTPGTRAISSGPGSKYSGKYQYRDDANIIRLLSFGVDTERVGQPPAILGDTWATCAGTALQVRCAGTSYIKPRHFTLTTLWSGGDQKHKVPHATSTVGENVFACGRALANLESAACLDYEGESDKLFNRTLGIEL